MFILFPFKTVHRDIYCLQLFLENESSEHLMSATFCIKVARKILQLLQLFLPATISAYKVLHPAILKVTHLAITCSKLTKGVVANGVALVSLLLILNFFHASF